MYIYLSIFILFVRVFWNPVVVDRESESDRLTLRSRVSGASRCSQRPARPFGSTIVHAVPTPEDEEHGPMNPVSKVEPWLETMLTTTAYIYSGFGSQC